MSSKKIKSRYYNQLLFNDGTVIKISSRERIQRESEWYTAAEKINKTCIATLLSVNLSRTKPQLTLKQIKGLNCFDFLRNGGTEDDLRFILQSVKKIITQYSRHTKPSKSNDFFLMYLEKPLNGIKYFYENYEDPFSQGKVHINGVFVERPEKVLKKVYKWIAEGLEKDKYQFIHGDLTLSNILLTRSKRLYLIDPRGNFGNTSLFGHYLYDTAKLYFSVIDNFDSFNNHKYKLERPKATEFVYSIEPNNTISALKEIFWQNFEADKQTVEYINATIWLSLSPHLCETHKQTLVAYLHGTLMLNQLSLNLGL